MLGNIGLPELLVICFLALLLFGPGKLPEVGKAAGNMIREFKKAMEGKDEEAAPAARKRVARKRGGAADA